MCHTLSHPLTCVVAVLCVVLLLPLQVAVMMVVEVLPVTVLLYPAAQAGLTLSIGKYGEVRLSGSRAPRHPLVLMLGCLCSVAIPKSVVCLGLLSRE